MALIRGQLVQVLLPGGKRQAARLSKHAPYRRRGISTDGWYVLWHPRPQESWESAGGWQPTTAIEADHA